jgi:FAD/FMN-containing dehydrogenase
MTEREVYGVLGEQVAEEAIESYRGSLRGALLRPGDEGYDEARTVWNGNIDRYPALIAKCNGVADVIAAVNFARENQLLVAVRGGGHNAAGHGTCDGGIVIDLRPMKGIRVDPLRRIATVEPGCTWAELDHETLAFGLATTGGTVSNTGVAGLTLGGGEGWLMGQHGLTCDNLLGADVVTADGQFLHASATENPDLFWGLRGGGGNFGVVTTFEFQLHPVPPMVIGGLVVHPIEKARELLRFFRDFSRDLPDEADAACALLTMPDGTRVAAMILIYTGDLTEGEKVLAPAREFGPPVADLVQPMPYAVRQRLLDDGVSAHGVQRYWKSAYDVTFGDEVINELATAAEDFSSPMSVLVVFHLHGAAARVLKDATAFALREPQWDINAIAQWTDRAESEQHIAWVREAWSRIEPHTNGNAYVNHLAGDDRPEKVRASFGSNFERLAALKGRYDPANLFRLNPNISPG